MQPLRSQPPPPPPSQKGQYQAYSSHNPPASYGQFYQYQPVMQAPQPAYPQIYRPEVPYSKNWFFFKDGLQALGVVFCVIGLALSLSLLDSRYGYLTIVLNVPVVSIVDTRDVSEAVVLTGLFIVRLRPGLGPD